MAARGALGICAIVAGAFLLADSSPAAAQAAAATANPPAQAAAPERDGQHDFDSLIGTWKFHLKRRLHRLAGSNVWEEFEGTGTCIKVWDGRSNLDQVELNGPGGHIEGLTLRLYNPASHQWSLYWANAKDGSIGFPPQIGEFRNGRGEFYAQDVNNGKTILVRFLWTGMDSKTPHFEQAYSADGGKTWETNWITDQTRVLP